MCPLLGVGTGYRGSDVMDAREQATAQCGMPTCLWVDHGPEFVSRGLDLWRISMVSSLIFPDQANPRTMPLSKPFMGSFDWNFWISMGLAIGQRPGIQSRDGGSNIIGTARMDREELSLRGNFFNRPMDQVHRPWWRGIFSQSGLSREADRMRHRPLLTSWGLGKIKITFGLWCAGKKRKSFSFQPKLDCWVGIKALR